MLRTPSDSQDECPKQNKCTMSCLDSVEFLGFMVCGLDLRNFPAKTRLTIYCWLYIVSHPCAWAQISGLWDVHLTASNGFKRRQLTYLQLGHSSCGWEGVRSTLLTWEHQKSNRNHEKSMILKTNQDTYGDLLRYQESPGTTFDTTRRHKTQFQEVDFHKNLKNFTKSLRIFRICGRNSEPGVDTVGIYVENHYNRCREFFKWIQFDFWNIGEKGFLP